MPAPAATPRDLPAVAQTVEAPVRVPLSRVREEVQRLLGLIGVDRLDMAVTYRHLLDSGYLDLSSLDTARGGRPPGTLVPPNPPEEIDLTPPPDPTGLAVSAGFSAVIIEWDPPVYTQGHGHAQTNIYAVKRPIPDPNPPPVFGDAALVSSVFGLTTITSMPSELNTRWHVWIKWKSVDGVESVNPDGGINGEQADTAQDVTQLLDALTAAALKPSSPYSRTVFRSDLFAIAPEVDFYQEATPTGTVSGQLWFKPSTGVTRTWNNTGGTWDAFSVPVLFAANTTPIVEDGVTIPPGVYMDAANIRNLSALVARLGVAVIDDAKIASLSAAKITAGALAVGQYIRSTGFSAGVSGFSIEGNGNVELNNLVARGTIYASAGTIGGATMGSNYVRSPGWVAGSIGWQLKSDDTADFGSGATFGGQVRVGTAAVSGTTMTGSGAVFNPSGTWAAGNATRNISFNGTTVTMNGDLVATGNIVANAATVILRNIKATDSQSFDLGALGITSKQINSTINYTNDTGRPVEVEVSWSGAHVLTADASPAGTMSANGMYIEYTINGSPAGYSDPAGFDVPSLSSGASASWRMASNHVITLAAGDVLAIYTRINLAGTNFMTGTLDSSNATLRLAVVKV